MKNYKINKNQQALSDADIAQGKNFNEVVKAYKAAKTPLYKLTKVWIGSSVLLVASVVLLLFLGKLNKQDTVRQFVNPPMASADIKRATYVLNAQADSTIVYPSGSKIHVPANAFRDKKGNLVKGEVELHYREFKKPVDVFLAGIPMTYDSAGQQFHFETAGMMEISASQNGEGLNTNPDALVKVDMLSENADDRFNTYYLDTVEKKWKYQAQTNFNAPVSSIPDSAETLTSPLITKEDKNVKHIENEIAKLENQAPVAPKKAEAGKPRFSIKVDESEFPEIAVYKNVKFQVEDKNYKEDKANLTWSDIELKRIAGSLKYRITFINPTEKFTVIAVPVFGDKDYASANSLYNQKYKEYEAALEQKKAEAAKLKAELIAKERVRREEIQAELKRQAEQARADRKMQVEETQKEIKEMAEQQNAAKKNWEQASLVVRSFTVSDFGYWNSDHPCALPAGTTVVRLNLIDGKTKMSIRVQACYLIEKERNALFQFAPAAYTKGVDNFRYNTDKQNGVWVLTSDNKIAVAKYNEFKGAKREGNELYLEVTMLDKSLATTEEVRHYLEL